MPNNALAVIDYLAAIEAQMTAGSWGACGEGKCTCDFYGTVEPERAHGNATGIAAARNVLPALLECARALIETHPSHRAPGCWCGVGRDIEGYGHEPRCERARAALEKLAEIDVGQSDADTDTEHGMSSEELSALFPVLFAPIVERDEDGRCTRCGLGWPDERETLEPHECPPGFTYEVPRG